MRSLVKAAIATAALAAGPAAYAATYSYLFDLGPEAVGATGSGSATATFDDSTNLFTYDVTFSGLSGNTTVSHFHCCTATAGTGTAGVAVDTPSLLGFPVGVMAGSFSGSYDLDDADSFNPAFVTDFGGGTVEGARAAFLNGLNSGLGYLNIHSSTFAGGEIRGFAQAEVPEPATLALLGLGLVGLGLRRRTFNR